jgi:hypothetical protein
MLLRNDAAILDATRHDFKQQDPSAVDKRGLTDPPVPL